MDHRNLPATAPATPEMLVSLIQVHADPQVRKRIFTLLEDISYAFVEYNAEFEEEVIACIRKLNAKLKKLFQRLLREDIWSFLRQQLPITTHPPGITHEEISTTHSQAIVHCFDVFQEAARNAEMDVCTLNEFWKKSMGRKTLRRDRSLSEEYRKACDAAFIEN